MKFKLILKVALFSFFSELVFAQEVQVQILDPFAKHKTEAVYLLESAKDKAATNIEQNSVSVNDDGFAYLYKIEVIQSEVLSEVVSLDE